MEERKVIKIGGVEFYEDEAPAVGMYIFRRTKIIKVCQRKSGAKYGKIVAMVKRLENRGYFHIHDESTVSHWFDLNYIRDTPLFHETDIKRKKEDFEEFEGKFKRYFDTPTIYIKREYITRFDEYMEKYPVFKMWVESWEYRRRVEYGRDKFTSACDKYAVIRIWDETF